MRWKLVSKILGLIAAMFTLIGWIIKWMKENRENCYKEAGFTKKKKNREEDDFPPVN